MARIIWPGAPVAETTWVCFFAFWLLNMYVIWRGIESIKILDAVSAPFMIGIMLLLLIWITSKAGGLGPVLSQPSRFHTNGEFFAFFIPSLTGMVGFWATVALNIPDFTRYAKSQKAQMLGQALGLPPAMTLFSFIGVAVTSASAVIFGEQIWDPVVLIGRFQQPLIAFVALIAVLIATLATNVAANVVSPANDFANLAPRLISFRLGGLITGVIGILMMPWKLMASANSYVFGWLLGYSALLGPVAGVMIADYYLIRKRNLDVDDLYMRGGIYEYSGGFNPRAIVALVTGVAVALIGLVVPTLHWLYDYAWFVGFFASGSTYALLMQGYSPSGVMKAQQNSYAGKRA
jgi:NCS1 family nucleobase:cation symporter-1